MLRHRSSPCGGDPGRLAGRLSRLAIAALLAWPGAADARVHASITPRAPHAGEPLTVDLRGRGDVRVCISSPAGVAGCRRTPVPGSAEFTAPRVGRWQVTVRGDGVRLRRPLTVLPVGRKLTVLAAGDSMMVRVARHLSKQLEGPDVHVATDIHFGAGISDDFVLDWRAQARADIATAPPDVVVLFLGGSEGWPFGSIECCGPKWVAEYASRARAVMQTYMRGGATQVYWLTLPAARGAEKTAALRAANEGLGRATAGLAPWTRLVDVAGLLTPGFVFRSSMLLDGEPVTVRMADGLHLSRAGAIFSARMVASQLRSDDVLPFSADPDGRYRRG
jgi:lysophospholipase L1-like esterase